MQAQTLKRLTDQVQMSEHFVSKCSIDCRSCAVRPLIREACLAARLLHQPSLQPPLQSNQELLLDGQGPSGYAPHLLIQAFLKLGTKAQYVNMFVKYEHFTYETLADVRVSTAGGLVCVD